MGRGLEDFPEMAKFYFHSKSADRRPGMGTNESLGDKTSAYFHDLQEIPQWRKILSNFSIGEFCYNRAHYRTAEHAFQGMKISLVDESKGKLFTLESDSPLSHGNGEMARKNRKIVILNENQLREWNRMKDEIMEGILRSKFTQDLHSKRVLLATKDAELWHGARGIPNSRQVILEKIRKEIQDLDRERVALEDDTLTSVRPSKRQRIEIAEKSDEIT